MKKLLLPAVLCGVFGYSQAQISNGNLEDWTKFILFEHPLTSFPTMSSNYETFFENGSLNVVEVEGEESQAMRMENTVINDEVYPGYFIFGELPITQDGNTTFEGGFLIESAASLTSISMDLKYAFPNKSQGFVIVQFKSDGVPVGSGNYDTGTFQFPVNGIQDWERIEFFFEEGVDPSANQCVIALACGDLMNSDLSFMPGAFMEVDNIAFSQNADMVPGGNFQQFAYVPSIFYPSDFQVDIQPFERNFEQSEQAFEGLYALRLNTVERDGGMEIGSALLAHVEEEVVYPTIQIAENDDAISFQYYYSGGADRALAKVVFYKENLGDFTQVFEKELYLDATLGYEQMLYPFKEDLAENQIDANYMTLEFVSSIDDQDFSPQNGSILLIDNIEMSTALGIFKIAKNPSVFNINSYPNPTIGRVTFDFGTIRSGYYRVYNGQGQQIAIREFAATKSVVFDLRLQPAGKYLFKFYHNGGIQTERVMRL